MIWSTVRLRFRKSISGHHFQTIRKFANNGFQYQRDVNYNTWQCILTKKCVFPHVRSFTLIYGPYSCLTDVLFGPILIVNFVRFFKCSLNFRAHALQSELSKTSILNFVKFKLQSMSSKIERAFEKTNKISIKIGPKKTSIRQL